MAVTPIERTASGPLNAPANRLPASFAWLNVTQFLGALNDNLFKLLLVFLLVDLQGDTRRATVLATASAIFVLPFLLFAHAGGVLADRFSKRTVIVTMKALEVVVMGLGCAAVWALSPASLYAVLFLMSAQSALFGPSKYGIVPELVPVASLSKANGLLTGLTYLAIILGTAVPSYLLLNVLNRSFAGLAVFCVAVAAAGFAASFGIRRTPARGSGRFTPLFVLEIFRTLRDVRRDRDLLLAVLGSAFFMFVAAFLQQTLLLYGGEALKLDWIQSGYLFPVAGLGIGLGAVAAGRLSGRNIEFGVVPLGAVGLTAASLALGLATPAVSTVLGLVFLVGLSCGLFIVPLDAFIQQRSPPDSRGAVLACASFLGFTGVALSAGLLALLTNGLGLSARQCFGVTALLTATLAAAALFVLPDFLVRFVTLILTRCVYRIRVFGRDNVPLEGGALLVCNHASWVDALLLSATQQRRIRFVMARSFYRHRLLGPLFRIMQAIPISPDDPPRQILAALKRAREALDDGYLVCIFPEGAVTRNGNMLGFRPGMERILRGTSFPIVPVCIGGAWGSIFSYRYGRMLSTLPRRIPYPITIEFGDPLPADTPPFRVREEVQRLLGHAFELRKSAHRTLAHAFVRSARRHWFRPALSDSTGRRLRFGQALAAAVALGRQLDRVAPGEPRIGILLPASVAGALANLAATLTGRETVNLNFTVSRAALESSVRQARLRTVITSRAFLERAGLEAPPAESLVMIEDLAASVRWPAKVAAAALAALAPPRRLMTCRRPRPDDLATLMFTSGSTGEPKGVMLTHFNVVTNVEGFGMILRLQPDDGMCGVLPLFHAFGYTATLWCPMLEGMAVTYHPNPLDGAAVARLVRERKSTLLLATPTFLSTYARKARPGDFASLRMAVAGAEKLKAAVAAAFREATGKELLEGYGTTELSPVAAVNVPDIELGGLRQTGCKPGSIGHPIPGVTARIVEPGSGRPLPPGKEGLLWIRGPNVMRGYLDRPEQTAAVLREGWYDTGDVGRMDEDGFIFLTGRLSRFSKIGGEMVPHMAVEEKLLDALKAVHPVLAVTAVEDERKGEQLVVFYTDEAGSAENLAELIRRCDLPNLWKPRPEHLNRIEALPLLGSGKLDMQALRRMAGEEAKKAG